MSRERFLLRDGKLVPAHLASPHPRAGKRLGQGPMVISDDMAAARHMASGRVLESKSAFRRDTRSFNCIEVGNDAPTTRGTPNLNLPDTRPDIAEAWDQLGG